MMSDWRCKTCDALWTEGEFTESCEECGGGAMDAPCFLCGGRCGQRVHRAPMDSNDSGIAHWIGGCALPKSEQHEILRTSAESFKKRSEEHDRSDS